MRIPCRFVSEMPCSPSQLHFTAHFFAFYPHGIAVYPTICSVFVFIKSLMLRNILCYTFRYLICSVFDEEFVARIHIRDVPSIVCRYFPCDMCGLMKPLPPLPHPLTHDSRMEFLAASV